MADINRYDPLTDTLDSDNDPLSSGERIALASIYVGAVVFWIGFVYAALWIGRRFFLGVVVLACLTLARPVSAQTTAERWTYVAAATADVFTTARNINGGFTEANPIYAPIKSNAIGVAVGVGVGYALNWFVASKLDRNHPKIARSLRLVGVASGVGNGVRNQVVWSLNR